MTCPDKLYQLELVVKSLTWCGLPDDGKCGVTFRVRFLDNPEQTVCEIPAATQSCKADGTATVITVNAGKTFTFTMPGSCPKPVRLAARLCRMTNGETTALGELCVTPSVSCSRPITANDEQTLPMTECRDGRTVVLLTVRARAWNAGPVTATSVEPKPACCPPEPKPACCLPEPKSTCCSPEPKPTCCPPEPKPPCCPQETKPPCCPREPKPPCCPRETKPSCCPREPKPPCCPPKPPCCPPKPPCCPPKPPCCPREPKPSCCPMRTCRRLCCCRRTIVVQSQPQYMNVGCEIDGRKIDLRVRKKNCETCAVQKLIANEAEDFATRVVDVVKDMCGLITDSKKCLA